MHSTVGYRPWLTSVVGLVFDSRAKCPLLQLCIYLQASDVVQFADLFGPIARIPSGGRSAEVNNRFTSAKIIGEWIPTEPVDCGMGSEEWREESEFGDRRKEVGNIISQFVFIATDEEGVNI